ncbi:fatty acyl-CoA reductase wat-like [Anopheles cruzii]|uniref:fatty acyl-CoA reductase wat-like n=1 Tax=Anopheles cruzii TaxID=68878 RepID=UPI0022EC48DC|nr:fatty acyl-CoA reductase wat-like [Anopheles cruzii]
MGDFSAVLQAGTADVVTELYRDSCVLITGGTGFIGKVLLEKLLRCFAVRKVFLMMRAKRNKSVAERFQELLDDAIVFNVMASVKFNEDIETALDTNVVSSRKLFQLVEPFVALRSIVHVSTFYSNCHRPHIEERIYEDLPFGGFENLLNILRFLSVDEKNHLKPLVLGSMPNSYTFSKRCAEVMIRQQFAHLPLVIFRPPIVTSAYREPFPGWVDNFNGAAGMAVPVTRGQIYWMRGEENATADMVPVDYCVNALLAVGWDNATAREPAKDPKVPVYNYVFQKNPIRNGDIGELVALGLDSPLMRILGRYFLQVTSSVWVRRLLIGWLLFQATIADLVGIALGRSKKNYTLVKRVVALDESTSYFRCRSWTSDNANIRRLWDRLPADTKRLLPFDVELIDWRDYFRFFAKGVSAAVHRLTLKRCESLRVSDRTKTMKVVDGC